MDLVGIPVALLVTLVVGLATKVVDTPTFGSFTDYATVGLWGFGLTALTDLTSAAWPEVKKAVLKQE